MEHLRIEDVDRTVDCSTVQRPLTDPLDAQHVALNYYELAPGDSFAYGYHRHADQEEVFAIQQGTVTFETVDGDIEVESGEVIRFAPGEFQQGTNRGGERVVALAIGAPQTSGDSEIRRHCPDCGDRTEATIEWADGGDAKITICLDCGAETGRFT